MSKNAKISGICGICCPRVGRHFPLKPLNLVILAFFGSLRYPIKLVVSVNSSLLLLHSFCLNKWFLWNHFVNESTASTYLDFFFKKIGA